MGRVKVCCVIFDADRPMKDNGTEIEALSEHGMPIYVQNTGCQNFPELIDVVKRLSVLQPYRAMVTILFDWAIIVFSIWLGVVYAHPLTWIASAIVIASRQHGLAILMHDAAHYRLVPDRRLNDLISNFFLAYPLLITTEGYRASHLAHHKYLNTDKDPDWLSKKGHSDWHFPKKKMHVLLMLVKMATVGGILQLFQFSSRYGGTSPGDEAPRNWMRLFYYGVLAIAVTLLGGWKIFFLFWFIPLVTFLAVMIRIRSIAEHFGLSWNSDLTSSRSCRCRLWERLLITPHQAHYHLEHHLYPSIPFYNLPALHKRMMEVPGFQEAAHCNISYFGSRASVLNDISPMGKVSHE